MNGTNKALYWVLMGVVSVYVGLSLVLSALQTYDGDEGLEIWAFSLINAVASALIPDGGQSFPDAIAINVSDAFSGIWDSYTGLLNAIYFKPLEPVSDMLGDSGPALVQIIFMAIGAALVIFGMQSKTWQDCRGPGDDPRQFLLTHRKFAAAWAAELPWNTFLACFRRHYALVVVPIVFLPAMLPFAVLGTVVSLVFFAIEWLCMAVSIRNASSKDRRAYREKTGFGICPECRAKFDYPRTACPRCKLTLGYPVPDAHGTKSQYCNNGHTIPCSNAKGARAVLMAVCPRCGATIKTREARPHAYALIGASGSGKTTIMLSAVDYICERAKEKEVTTEEGTAGISKDVRRNLGAVVPTPAGEIPSQTLFVHRRDLGETELVFNDISGEEFEPEETRDLFEEYYQYAEGLVFVIDPFDVVNVHLSKSLTKGSKVTPKTTFDTFFQIYSAITGMGPSSTSDVPLAVVLTKVRTPRVASLIAKKTPEEFLRDNGQGEFVNTASSLFKNVKYYKADSVDSPAEAAAPFLWMLEENDARLYNAIFGTHLSERTGPRPDSCSSGGTPSHRPI